jgi:hypothetical protein
MTTLAEVLEAMREYENLNPPDDMSLDDADEQLRDFLDGASSFACTAYEYFRIHRAELERWEWRRKMRAELTAQHAELTDRKFANGLTDEETTHLEQVRDVLDQLDETLIIPDDWRPEAKP